MEIDRDWYSGLRTVGVSGAADIGLKARVRRFRTVVVRWRFVTVGGGGGRLWFEGGVRDKGEVYQGCSSGCVMGRDGGPRAADIVEVAFELVWGYRVRALLKASVGNRPCSRQHFPWGVCSLQWNPRTFDVSTVCSGPHGLQSTPRGCKARIMERIRASAVCSVQ